ncbi:MULTISPECIES: Gfo/Idh/MocA family protein [Clostridium]|uniref:Gfo/Idh/MocA family oxidoreductase n=1 Tax=Clostridium frigoriphilum TaxID=443253 RepID=A0ABU7US63_9CLOT|nr:Gfo/Idh/MocA family oxidoreductase [Clostridium sp. DSM 17811]MBU3101136.1 Gfo/Idh/MocA family oxidoreductase [Clostridium sp. DSM 17811]
MNVKLGILGFGGMGKWHEENARRVDQVEIIASCDIKEEKRKESEARGVKSYEFVDDFLANPDINTVLLTVPNYLHKEMAIKAAKAGKNIICEKPAALNVKELDEMTQAAKDNNVIFTVHQNRRWDKDFQIVKKVYEENLIGKIFTIESKLHTANGRIHEWHLYKKYGGGMMYDWGVHLIDQTLFMMGDAHLVSVFADIKSIINDEVDDYFKILMKFDNGITVHLELGTYILSYQPRWLVAGNRGTLKINSFACDGEIWRTSELLDKLPAQIAETVAGPTRQFAPQPAGVLYSEALPEVKTEWTDFYKNFVQVINGKEELKIKIPEVRKVLSVMEAAFESSETNKAIMF